MLVPRRGNEGGRSVSDEEAEGEKVEDAIRRLDNINTSFKAGRLAFGGSSEEIGKGEIVVAGVDTLIGDTDGKIESNDSETRHLNPNDTSSGRNFGAYGGKEELHEFQHSDSSISWGNSNTYTATHNTNSRTSQGNRAREGNLEIGDLLPSEFLSGSEFEAQKVSQESLVTKSTVLSQPQQVNNNTGGSWCHGGLLSSSGTLSGVVASLVIDTQAPGSAPSEDKHREQVSPQQLLNPKENRCYRSVSLPQCVINTSAAASSAAIWADKGKIKSLPAKLNPADHNERLVINWKRKQSSSVFSREEARRSVDTTSSSASSSDAPDTPRWRGVLSKLSVRRVGNTVLTAVTQLFSHFLSKPSSSRGSSYKKASSGKKEQEDPQETAEDTVRRRKEASTQQGVENKGEAEDNDLTQSGTGKRVACGAGEKHDTEEKVLSSKVDESGGSFATLDVNEKIQVNEAGEARDDNHDSAEREEVNQGTIRVKDLVRKIESITRGSPDTENQEDPKLKRLRDEAVQKMRLPLARQLEENEPIKVKEISKGGSLQDTNILILQSATNKMKENEDQTYIETTNQAAESKLLLTRDTDGMETRRGIAAEEEKGEKEMAAEEADESESDTEEESEDENSGIVMRSNSRGRAFFNRFSMVGQRMLPGQTTSIYRYSMVRPRTVIIGLG